MRAHPIATTLGFVLVTLASGCSITAADSGESGIAASCAGPMLHVPAVVLPASTVALSGEFFLDHCADTGGPAARPLAHIQLTFTQHGVTRSLALVHAVGQLGSFTSTVVVPADAVAGVAQLGATAGAQNGYGDSTVAVTVALRAPSAAP